MATEGSGTTSSSGLATIFGSASTVTYTTTITASGLYSQASFTALFWPTPSTTVPIEYTSVATPTDPAPKYFTDPLPIFIATCVDIVVVNTAGRPITTLIEVEAQPAIVYGVPAAGSTGTNCTGSTYTCWSAGKRAVVIIGIILGGLFVLVFTIWFCCFMRIPGSRAPDEEEAYALSKRDRTHGADAGGVSRRRRVTRSDPDSTGRQRRNRVKKRNSSLSARSYTEPPKPLPRIVTVQDHRQGWAASVPQRVLASETSSFSTGRRAVVGVGPRDIRRDAMCFDETAARNMTTERKAAKDITVAKVHKTARRARSSAHAPQQENSRKSRNQRNNGHQKRGRSPVRKNSSRRPQARLQRYAVYLLTLVALLAYNNL